VDPVFKRGGVKKSGTLMDKTETTPLYFSWAKEYLVPPLFKFKMEGPDKYSFSYKARGSRVREVIAKAKL
jgi:hypothetical protein